MDIIFVTAGMRGGGTERVISILANKWAAEGYRITILATADNTVAYKLHHKIRLIQLGERTNGNIFKRIKRIFLMRKIFLKEKNAIICSMGVETNMYTVLATRGLHRYVMISERNDPGQCNYCRLRNLFYKRADRLICQTDEAKDYFFRRGMHKLSVIPNPVNENLPDPFKGERRKTIAAAGRLTAQKNHKLLIEAFKKFSEAYPEYTLEIYGEGELKPELEELIKSRNLADKVTLMGFSNTLLEEIRDCSMYVLSSDYEGVSNSLMEAMAVGMPVIATDCPIGGSAMCIENGVNGLLVPVNDERALANGMCMLAGDPEKLECISEAARSIKDRFSIDKISKLWINAMEEGRK